MRYPKKLELRSVDELKQNYPPKRTLILKAHPLPLTGLLLHPPDCLDELMYDALGLGEPLKLMNQE